MGECVNCGEPATGRYTLAVQTGLLIQDKPFCQSCLTLFRGGHRFEVHEAPVLLRGGDEGPEDE